MCSRTDRGSAGRIRGWRVGLGAGRAVEASSQHAAGRGRKRCFLLLSQVPNQPDNFYWEAPVEALVYWEHFKIIRSADNNRNDEFLELFNIITVRVIFFPRCSLVTQCRILVGKPRSPVVLLTNPVFITQGTSPAHARHMKKLLP